MAALWVGGCTGDSRGQDDRGVAGKLDASAHNFDGGSVLPNDMPDGSSPPLKPDAGRDTGVDAHDAGDASFDASSDAAVEPPLCTGPTVYGPSYFAPKLGKVCYGLATHGLPNSRGVLPVGDLALPEAMKMGQRYTLSLDASATARQGIEIWGTDEECGEAKELLWFDEVDGQGAFCAQMIPSANYPHVLLVERPLEGRVNSASIGPLAVCPQEGVCPAGPNGTGSNGTDALAPPIEAYEVTSVGKIGPGTQWTFTFGGTATMAALYDNPSIEEREQVIRKGYFRLPSGDPFGDAWYCIGEGSTVTRHADSVYDVNLRNVTRLGACQDQAGSERVSATLTQASTRVESSVAAWNTTRPEPSRIRCDGFDCTFEISYVMEDNGFARLTRETRLHAFTSAPVGTYSAPSKEPANIVRAAWIDMPMDDAPVTLSCTESGTMTYDPEATSSFAVEHVSEAVACPGLPIARSSLDLTLYFH